MKTLITIFKFDRDESGHGYYGYYEHLIHDNGIMYLHFPGEKDYIRCKLIDGYVIEERETFASFGVVLRTRFVHGKYTIMKTCIVGFIQKVENIYK